MNELELKTIEILVIYTSGLRRKYQYKVRSVSELCNIFAKKHNMKLIKSASIVYMSSACDGFCSKFNEFIVVNSMSSLRRILTTKTTKYEIGNNQQQGH